MPKLPLLHVKSYTVDCFFRSQGSIKKKVDYMLEPIVPNISNSFYFISFPTSSRPVQDFSKIAA